MQVARFFATLPASESETATEAVKQAVELAQATKAKVELVSAYEPVSNTRLRQESTQVPDDLQWMPCGLGHSAWVRWALGGDVHGFYEELRWPTWGEDVRGLAPADQELVGIDYRSQGVRDGRSEERRVGKECRSRWSPYH